MRLPIFIALLFLFIAATSYGQEDGKSFIQNFPPNKYESDGQNWGIAQGSRGLLYVANTSDVLEYDGKTWQKIKMGDNLTLIAEIASDQQGAIYASATSFPYDEFGYLLPNENGKLEYQSIAQKLDTADRDVGDIYRIFPIEEHIFFIGTKGIVEWNASAGVRKIWRPSARYEEAFLLDEKIYVQDGSKWLFMQEGKWQEIPNSEALNATEATFIVPYAQNKYLMASRRKGLFLFDISTYQLEPFPSPVQAILAENNLRHLIKLPNQNYAFATSTAGIVIMNKAGEVAKTIDKSVGMIDNEVDHLFLDNQNGLWAALGNGIARIEINSPIGYWFDEVGGWVTTLAQHQGAIYAGALGLYRLEKGHAYPIQGIDNASQAWALISTPIEGVKGGKLLYGCDDGIYEIEGKKGTLVLSTDDAVYSFASSKIHKNRVYAGLAKEFVVLEYQLGRWSEIGRVKGIKGQVRTLAEDANGNIWATTANHGVNKVSFPKAETAFSEASIIEYGTEAELPSKIKNRVYEIDGQVVFATIKGIYRFEEAQQRFAPVTKYDSLFRNRGHGAFLLSQDAQQNVWVAPFKTDQYPIAQIQQKDRGELAWHDASFRRLPVMEMEEIIHDENGVSWIAGSEGLFRFDPNKADKSQQSCQVFIRQVLIGQDSVDFHGAYSVSSNTGLPRKVVGKQPESFKRDYPYKFNSVKFNFASPSFDNGEESNEYRYRLKGYRAAWSGWSKETKQGFTNLSAGDYTFEVMARNIYGEKSKIASYKFSILAPWYLTVWAYIIYTILVGLIIFGIVRLNTRRLKAQNQLLEQTVQARTAEIGQQKNQIEKAYNNIQTMSDIGQKITATLDFEELIQTIYQSVNTLMDAEAFGVGIYQEAFNHLAFWGFIENGKKAQNAYDSLDKPTTLSAYCFNELKPLFINDIAKEYESYLEIPYEKKAEKRTKSAICLPLLIESQPVGVITVQSFQKNAYSQIDLTFLQTLASYVAIALSNTTSYDVIKQKNEMIMDSIRYAQTIQMAVLPTKQTLKELLPQSFLVYKSKDIVSGDFYWVSKREDRYYIAVIDCTGHGVPGAFMSLMGYNIMNEAINQHKMDSPADILQYLHDALFRRLRQADGENKDGMDTGLAVIKPFEGGCDLVFAGAKNKLISVSKNGELTVLAGSRRNIGGIVYTDDSFENFSMQCYKGDMIYLFSDGFIDQNNSKRRKFGSKQLMETFQEIHQKPIEEQKAVLLEKLAKHQGEAEQRDDITMLGFRIS